MGFLKSLTTSAATVIPAAAVASFGITSLSTSPSSHTSCTNSLIFKIQTFPSLSKRFSPPLTSLHMDAPTTSPAQKQQPSSLPELVTEFMVDMKCDGCVTAVKSKLLQVEGVKGVEADLSNQVVRVVGSSPVKTLADALEQIERKARLIGQGN